MMIISNLIIFTFIICFIIDVSGFIDSVKQFLIKHILKMNLKPEDLMIKPLDCSLCISFWFNIIYLIIIGKFIPEYIFIVCLCSLLTTNISDLLYWFKDLFVKIQFLLNKLVK